MEIFSTNIIFPKESKNENVEIFVRLRDIQNYQSIL
jgi:hypothetical protein